MTSLHFKISIRHYFLSLVCILIGSINYSTDARSVSIKGDVSDTNVQGDAHDCPNLSANFGDVCDDGNVATQNDIITADCICAGTYTSPANDSIENAQELSIFMGDTMILGTTLGAHDELGPFECDSLNGPWPDVFYTYNSGNYIDILISITLITQADLIISVSEVGEDGDLVFCNISTEHFYVNKQTDYIIRIAPASGLAGAGEFGIHLYPSHLCFELPNMDPGDPCYTYFYAHGYLNDDCQCIPVVTDCSNPFFGGTVALSNSSNVIHYGTHPQKHYLYFTNATAGNEYTITSSQFDTPGFITVRAAGFGVIGAGFSPLSITSPVTGSLTVDLNLDQYCSMSNAMFYQLTSQCTSCEFTCPEIQGNYGDPCSDGNPNSVNDTIDEDCNCTGEYEAASLAVTANWNSNCTEKDLSVALYAPGDTTMLYSFTTSIEGDGTFELSDDIAAGNYDIYAKLDGFLAKGFYNVPISAGSNTLTMGSFKPGDLNNDNVVNILDVSLLNLSFGLSDGDSNFNYLADVNCNGYVNLIDVSILIIYFTQGGAHP